MNKTTAILIASFEGNRDLWPIFHFFFEKYWPDCPYTIYLGANGADGEGRRIERSGDGPAHWNYIHKGPDRGWSESMLDYLEEVEEESVLLMLDDFILTDPPDTAAIARAADYTVAVRHEDAEAVYLRLNPEPRPRRIWRQDPTFGRLRWFDRYRASLKAALWNRAFLQEALGRGLDPWSFEMELGALPEYRDRLFLGAYRWLLPNRHCVESGKYSYWVPDYFAAEGYDAYPAAGASAPAVTPASSTEEGSEGAEGARLRPILSYEQYTGLFSKGSSLKGKIVDRLPALPYYLYRRFFRRGEV